MAKLWSEQLKIIMNQQNTEIIILKGLQNFRFYKILNFFEYLKIYLKKSK